MTVYKFGGTSLADADRYRHAAELVNQSGGETVVVVSAPAGVTNQLVELVREAKAGHAEAASRLVGELRRRCEAIAGDLDSENPALMEAVGDVFSTLEGSVAGMSRDGVAGPHFADAISAVGEDASVQLMAAALTRAGLDAELVDASVPPYPGTRRRRHESVSVWSRFSPPDTCRCSRASWAPRRTV